MTSNQWVLRCQSLVKEYKVGPEPIRVLDNLEFNLQKGDWVSIVGASGSGKTTLLNMLAGLDSPTQGKVLWGEQDIQLLNEASLGKFRNQHLGFVYQFHHLLAEFSAIENVAMPLWIQGINKSEALARASEMLAKVGLKSRVEHKPAELSGGERQRVAIARALITQPALVLLDEPTGNLDASTAHDVQQLIAKLNQDMDTAFVVVTHDQSFARLAKESYTLLDGQLKPMVELA
ncbi:lipoprotein-releasing ABC transporter ATP-binding protein LolD [Oceaniserpentilla sp. 4NH20-0058]|uniref:ABC transporter ATP-binding protein n=1 Tax=Oceaniserpentilla sp. 4NH20-0058 TaxID=3127660 RepID=UPI0031063B9C